MTAIEKNINRDIISRGISNMDVIEAMYSIPREKFILQTPPNRAYDDSSLPIGHGQTISQPYIVALMTEEVSPNRDDRVLEIGTGSGYQTAVLAKITKHVYTIERILNLHLMAKKTLSDLGFSNISLYHGDGYSGLKEEAPFDIIMLTSAPDKVPKSLFPQLNEGGRLIAPVGTDIQKLVLYKKSGRRITAKQICFVRFVPMIEGVINN